MPCCKAKGLSNWCAAEPTFEYEGKEYCIFHAPAECPEKQDVEAFNKKVFERIDKCKEDGKKCNLSGAIFPGDISFSAYNKDNPLPAISFNYATFSGNVFCNTAVFSGYSSFNFATFSGGSEFQYAKFKWYSSFISATFSGHSNFFYATFGGDSYFIYATFGGYSNFKSAKFSCKSKFFSATFSGLSSFILAKFIGKSDFIRTTFSGDSYFDNATFSGDSDFRSVTFSGNSDFRDATFSGKSNFGHATFERSADFLDSKFKKLASFDQSHFKHHACFRRTTFDAGTFSDCIVDKHIEFERADISRLSLLRAPIESMRFIDCIWPESKGRKVVYDARKVDDKGYFKLSNVTDDSSFSDEDTPPEPGRLADLFRRLKKVARAEADEPLASDWHYAEKEMQRLDAKQNKRSWFALGLWLYKLVSGYGESPSRAGLWLVVLALLPWLAHECLDVIMKTLPRDPLPNVQTLAWLNAAFSTPKEYISASINHDATGCYLYTLWLRIYQTLLLVQAGLFGLAVRNKMRR